jgi:anti-anti-sigma factor
MNTQIANTNGKSVIRLAGRFDFNAHRTFRDAYEPQLLDGSVREVEIDLGQVDYLDSSALGMLLMLKEKAEASAKAVALVNCKGTVKQVLDIANFSKLFRMN